MATDGHGPVEFLVFFHLLTCTYLLIYLLAILNELFEHKFWVRAFRESSTRYSTRVLGAPQRVLDGCG